MSDDVISQSPVKSIHMISKQINVSHCALLMFTMNLTCVDVTRIMRSEANSWNLFICYHQSIHDHHFDITLHFVSLHCCQDNAAATVTTWTTQLLMSVCWNKSLARSNWPNPIQKPCWIERTMFVPAFRTNFVKHNSMHEETHFMMSANRYSVWEHPRRSVW